jgi:vacuolar-type H+-ATPase subunit I/STV1
LSCATPFPALAALAALILPLRSVVVAMVAAWAVNQMVGFGFLNYPHDTTTLIWAFVMGLSAVTAGVCGSFIVKRYGTKLSEYRLISAALVAGFIGFQAVIFVANLAILGHLDAFTLAIKAKMALINIGVFALLYLTTHLAMGPKVFPRGRFA